MPAARGVKRTASKTAAPTASAGPKNKKKRNVIQLEVPTLPKRRGRVLTCGQGDVGQLGLGGDVVETSRFKHVSGLGEKIVDVCAGGMHTIALDSDGKVWTFGCNDEGALGRATSSDTDEGTPNKVALPLPAVAISAGDSHSAALLNNGDVYAWGSFRDSHGSMGLVVRGREGKACKDPVKVEVNEPAAEIASGSDHLVILTTSGLVLTMGCGEQGQLGRLAQRSATRDTRAGFTALLTPSKVTLKAGASHIWAGYHATFVLDGTKDKLYGFGLNNYSQLGITGEKRKTALFGPTECDAFTAANVGWKCVAAGQHHSIALDTNGQVYAVGRVEYGRLGLGERAGDAESLEAIPKLHNKKVISIAAGTSNSFAVTDTGEIFAWGMGSEGQLGTGGSSDAREPTSVTVTTALSALHVTAGGQHTALLVEDPNAKRSPSPAPEKETEEEKVEDKEEEPAPEPEKKGRGRGTKRQKKQEQEDEVSSTSSAQPSQTSEGTAPQKVNGDEKKQTPMEVDETDNKVEKMEESKEETNKEVTKENTDTDNTSQDSTESSQDKADDVEMKETTEKPETDVSETKMDTSETKKEKSETKVEKSETKTEVSESKTEVSETESKTEVNGTPEENKIEQKTVESLTAEQPLATTA